METFGEPGAVVYLADCVDLMRLMPAGSVDAVFADSPYRLSNGGSTVENGRLASVDKGSWDRSLGSFGEDHAFNERWLREARRILKPGGTIWVSGTHHVIFSLGFALQTLGFKVINSVAWEKPDPPPNALHMAFTHGKAVAVRLAQCPSSGHPLRVALAPFLPRLEEGDHRVAAVEHPCSFPCPCLPPPHRVPAVGGLRTAPFWAPLPNRRPEAEK